MIKAIKKFFWKWSYLRKLESDAFVKEAMAVYSDGTIEDIRFLKTEDLKFKEKLEKEIAELAGETEYTKTRHRRDLEKDLEEVEIKIKGRDRSIESVRREAETLRLQAAEMWHRRKIFKERF